jgi:hypothetical protein
LEQLSVFQRLTLHLRGDDHGGIATHSRSREFRVHVKNPAQTGSNCIRFNDPPPLPYFKVNICPFPLPHFSSIFFAYLWSVCWPNCIVTLPRYFSFRLPHLNIHTGPHSDEKRADAYLEVRKRRWHIFFEWNKCLCYTPLFPQKYFPLLN